VVESVAAALVSGALTLAGVLASNSKSRAVMEEKIDELTRRVERHNCLVERTYALERDVAVLRSDVDGLERKAERDE
jgi:outer membrane murein-binding lipoprotein Lpp